MKGVPTWVWGLGALLVLGALLGQVTVCAMREQSAVLEWSE